MKKKTPKRSKKSRKLKKERNEKIVVFITFLVFVAVVAALFYFMEINPSAKDTVAVVNGKDITRDELNWWYETSILPEYRDGIAKQNFLVSSLIPQEVLLQKAKDERIKVTEEEVEKLLGIFIIENGFTMDEFENHLNSRGMTINDIKTSFEIRGTITKLLEKENIQFIDSSSFDANDIAFQEYLNDLINNSKIEIFLENIEKLTLESFEETGDELCGEEKLIVRLYTTSTCKVCGTSVEIFEDSIKGFGNIDAAHWVLDKGDDLLTLKEEKAVPKDDVALFKKYSPDKLVPTIVAACKYKRVGVLDDAEEFRNILKNLAGG